MARITRVQRQANKEKYDIGVYELFLDVGWEQLTYERVSKHLNIKKSTLQSYYPSRHDFYAVWRDRQLPRFRSLLKFDSREAFLTSWEKVLEDEILSSLVGYAISHAVLDDDTQPKFPFDGTEQLVEFLSRGMSEKESRETVQIAIGMTVLKLSQTNKQ